MGTGRIEQEEKEAAALAVYKLEGLQIDESKWLPFLRKDRWFDWYQKPPSNSDEVEGKTWSVDDPDIWNAIKTSIELLNRMLEALIEDKNDSVCSAHFVAFGSTRDVPFRYQDILRTVLWGSIEDWDEVAEFFGSPDLDSREQERILLDFKNEEHIANEDPEDQGWRKGHLDQIASKTSADWRDRLNHLCSTTLWSFSPASSTNAQGVTVSPDDNTDPDARIVVFVNIEFLKRLADEDLCLGELCAAQFFTAHVMLHELMHVIISARDSHLDEDYIGNGWDKSNGRIGYEPVRIFRFPTFRPRKDDAHKELQYNNYLSPDRRSDNFFHKMPFLIGKSPNNQSNTKPTRWQSPELQDNIALIATSKFLDGDGLVSAEMSARRTLWRLHRDPWFTEENQQWGTWSARDQRLSFTNAFAVQDGVKCLKFATHLVRFGIWSNKKNYDQSLPKPDSASGTNWVWHCLGLLMMASIPIRQKPFSPEGERGKISVKLGPSREAVIAGYRKRPRFVELSDYSGMPSVGRSEFWHDVNGKWSRKPVESISQQDYIDRVALILNDIQVQSAIVHKEFHDAVVVAHQRVNAARAAFNQEYPNDADKVKRMWSPDWIFDIPDYNPRLEYHDSTRQAWVPKGP
ncbi:hypothetical protein F5Y16DRAFT_395273 [Xylariaceae sp. FL0255]|nr:hypothetical protein F5Y16DRAFT_395273 [Xylariaceae sp. FL0255]